MPNRDIQPIETVYRGCRFRSRLEARWAVFFQTLGVPWEYEPEGFTLSDGRWYLPDFRVRLADGPLWAEVKPPGGIGDDGLFYQFLADLNGGADSNRFDVRGVWLHEIPDPADVEAGRHGSDGLDFHTYGDYCYQFCICEQCDGIGFEFSGRSERIHCGCEKRGEYQNFNHPRILNAYDAARAARFEHGEQT